MKDYNISDCDTKQNEKEKRKLKRKVIARNVTILGLIIIIIMLLLRSCGSNDDLGTKFEPILQNGSIIIQNNKPEQKEKLYVTMPVVDDFKVSSENPNIVLYCPEQNKGLFYITYTFIDSEGNVIYQSNPAEGGTKWSVNFKELLPEGQHDITVQLSSMYCDTGKDANGVVSDITVTVEKQGTNRVPKFYLT